MTRALRFAAVLLAAVLLVADSATGRDNAAPARPYQVCAEFFSNPTTVVADVQEIGGSQIGNNVATVRGTLDAANATYFCVDLDTVSGFAANCDQKSYAVRFVPDAANCASSPALCATALVSAGGPTCWSYGTEQTVVFTSVPIPARGITQTVINRGNPSYIKHEVKIPEGGTVAFTWYQVFYYDASGRVERSVRSSTIPSP